MRSGTLANRLVYSPDAVEETTKRMARAAGDDGRHPPMSEPKEFLVENLPLVRQITAAICRRRGMAPDDIEDFICEVQLRLVSDNYAVIRSFRGWSSFATYLAAVVTRQLLDYRNRNWGKWHPSAEAERLGELALAVERALYRVHLTVDEALADLCVSYPDLTRNTLEDLRAKLPRRVRRKTVELDEAAAVASSAADVDPAQAESATQISSVVTSFLDRLPKDDQLILKLRFDSDMTVVEISRALHIEQPILYRRLYKLFHALRAELERAGVSAHDVATLIGVDTAFLDFGLKNRDAGPSEESAGRQEELP